MAIALLLRHGRTRANAQGLLAGWTPGIGLDERGQEQVALVAGRLRDTPIVAVHSSPLQRCLETAQAVLDARAEPALVTEDDLGEARYGAWTGRSLKDLAKEPLWKDVQQRPSSVTFPDGADYPAESMTQMQTRAVAVVQRIDAAVEAAHGPGAIWVAVSHGDVLKAILAHALATPLDEFQRIVVDPASVSVVRYTTERAFVLRTNDTSGDAVDLRAVSRAARPDDEAQVGGGAGSD